MRFNTLLKFSSLIGFAGLVHGSGYRMTFYGLNGNRPSDKAIPACGTDVHYDTDYYIALNQEQYYESQVRKDNPNTASVCDKCAKIMYNGKWVVGRIVDSCPGCPRNGLDVSPKIFEVFAPQSVGVVYMEWEYADCSLLGKSGSGNSSSSNSSSSNSSSNKSSSSENKDKKNSEKKGDNKISGKKLHSKKTTGMNKKTASSQKIINKGSKTIGGKTGTKTVTKSKPIGTNIVSANSTNPNNDDIIFEEQIPVENDENEKSNKKENKKVKENQNKEENEKENKKETIEVSNNLEDKDDGNSYVVPVTTGAFVVTGAAGVALLYAKRNSNNINNLKEKFPEAFSNIKRSISRGSTVVRRSLSQSGRKIKRSLSKKNSINDLRSPVGPQLRTRKEYRDSLNAHYPLQPIMLHDPPVPSASASTSTYSYVPSAPEYNLQHYSYDENIDRNLNIQIDNNNAQN